MIKFKEYLKKLRETILDDVPDTHKNKAMLTRESLELQIHSYFKQTMDLRSDHKHLVFDTDFTIYLNSKDYKHCGKGGFTLTVDGAMDYIEKTIEEELEKGKKSGKYLDFQYPSNYCRFRFIDFNPNECQTLEIDDEVINDIPLGKIYCTSEPYPKHSDKALPEENSSDEPQTIIGSPLMTTKNYSVNPRLTPNVYRKGDATYIVYWSKGKQYYSKTASSKRENALPKEKVLAVLKASHGKFIINGRERTTYEMTSDFIYVSGKNSSDLLEGVPVAKMNSEDILNPHLAIRYDSESKTFLISAIGKVKMAGINLPLKDWVSLPHKVRILLDQSGQFEFCINR